MKHLMIVCKIVDCKKIVVVPIKFIYELDLAKSLNNRLNRNQVHLMFWSNDFTKKPNFDLAPSHQFEFSTDSCFNVKLLRAFGK